MQETQEYKTFMGNVMQNPEMLEAMAKSPEDFQSVVNFINKLTDNRIPGGDFFKLSNAVNDTLVISSEAAEVFSDEDMLLLYKSYFQEWFDVEHFSKQGAGFGNPVFGAIQQAFTTSTKCNHIQCFEYLIKNVQIQDYDIDGLDMAIALKEQRKYILELLYMYADKNTYGKTGSLEHLVGPKIRQEFNDAIWMSEILRDKLTDFKILGA